MLLSATPRKGSEYWELEAAEGYGTASPLNLEGKYVHLSVLKRQERKGEKEACCLYPPPWFSSEAGDSAFVLFQF